MSRRAIRAVFFPLLLLMPVLAIAAMRMTAAAIPVPRDSEVRELSGLAYEVRLWTVEVKSVHLEEVPEAGAKSVTWVLMADNGRPRAQRVNLGLFLLDGDEKRVADVRKVVVLPAGSTDQEHKVKMKLKGDAWEKAVALKLEVSFDTL